MLFRSGAPAAVAKAKSIIGGSYVTFAGGPYSTVTVPGYSSAVYAAEAKGTMIMFKGKLDDGEYSAVIWYPGSGAGTIAWVMTKEKECHVLTQHDYPGGSIMGSFADPDSQKSHHDGSVTIDSYQPVGKFITGTFQGGFTYLSSSCENCFLKGSISGAFFAKRYR